MNYHKLIEKLQLVAYVDPLPIGKEYAEKNNFFPTKQYDSLEDMLKNGSLDLLMEVGSPNLSSSQII